MILIPTRWLKVIVFPLWPIALWYWWRAKRQGQHADWRTFDLWVGRAWWSALGVAFLVGFIGAALR